MRATVRQDVVDAADQVKEQAADSKQTVQQQATQ